MVGHAPYGTNLSGPWWEQYRGLSRGVQVGTRGWGIVFVEMGGSGYFGQGFNV